MRRHQLLANSINPISKMTTTWKMQCFTKRCAACVFAAVHSCTLLSVGANCWSTQGPSGLSHGAKKTC